MKIERLLIGLLCVVLCLCTAFLGVLGALELTLFREGYLMHHMKKTGYFETAADTIRASCQEYAMDAGISVELIDFYVLPELVQEDITINTDARFRGMFVFQPERFPLMADKIENQIHEATNQLLPPGEKDRYYVLQNSCEEAWAQLTRPPFDAALSVILQYRSVRKWAWISFAALEAASIWVLCGLSSSKEQIRQRMVCPVLGAAAALWLLALLFGKTLHYQSWMPSQNMAWPLFCSWMGGLAPAIGAAGVVIFAVLLYWLNQSIAKEEQKNLLRWRFRKTT